jgi:hypothetical protein
VFSPIGVTLVGTGAAAAAAAARGSFVAMASRPSFVFCCDDAYVPLLDAVLMHVRVKRNAESQSSMQDVSWPVGLADKICMMTTRLACNRAIESSYWRMDNNSDVGLLMGCVLYRLPIELEFMDLDTFSR